MHAERKSTMFASRTAGLPLNSSRKKLESDMMRDGIVGWTRAATSAGTRARQSASYGGGRVAVRETRANGEDGGVECRRAIAMRRARDDDEMRGDGGDGTNDAVQKSTDVVRAHSSIDALNPDAGAIDAAIEAQERTIEHLVRANECLRGVLGDGIENDEDDEDEDFVAARAATRVARDIAREMAEATATLARVKKKLIDAGVLRACDLTPFVPE